MHLTRAGAITLLMAIILMIAAFNTEKNLYHLISATLFGAFVINWLFARLSLTKLNARRSVPAHVYPEDNFSVAVTISNDRRVPVYGLVVRDAARKDASNDAPAETTIHIPAVAGRGKRTERYSPGFAKRGLYRFAPFTVESDFPFGFVRYKKKFGNEDELVVFPAFQPLSRPPDLPGISWENHLRKETAAVGDLNPSGAIREHRPGDPLRLIDWKGTARMRQPMVKILEGSHRGALALVLVVPRNDPKRAEKAISQTAAIVDSLCREQIEIKFLILGSPFPPVISPDGVSPRSLLERILTQLGALEPGASRNSSAALYRQKLLESLSADEPLVVLHDDGTDLDAFDFSDGGRRSYRHSLQPFRL